MSLMMLMASCQEKNNVDEIMPVVLYQSYCDVHLSFTEISQYMVHNSVIPPKLFGRKNKYTE